MTRRPPHEGLHIMRLKRTARSLDVACAWCIAVLFVGGGLLILGSWAFVFMGVARLGLCA